MENYHSTCNPAEGSHTPYAIVYGTTYLNNAAVQLYNIGGYTCIFMEDFAR